MSEEITKDDVKNWMEAIKAQNHKPSYIEILADENAFDDMPDKAFIQMCEDKRLHIHGTRALHKKIKERYKKLKG